MLFLDCLTHTFYIDVIYRGNFFLFWNFKKESFRNLISTSFGDSHKPRSNTRQTMI